MEKLVLTRKFDGESYNFYVYDMVLWSNGETVTCVKCETPENGLGYTDTILYDKVTDTVRTLHRHLPNWILNKCKAILKKLQCQVDNNGIYYHKTKNNSNWYIAQLNNKKWYLLHVDELTNILENGEKVFFNDRMITSFRSEKALIDKYSNEVYYKHLFV